MLAVVPGARSIENAEEVVQEVRRRVDPEVPPLLTSGEHPASETAIEHTFGQPVEASKGPGRPRIVPELRTPETVVYATVHKERRGQRAVAVTRRQIFGTGEALATALERSEVSSGVNTSLVERRNGADRGRDARKVRKSSRFSKDWRVHEAMTFPTMYADDSCWAVRTLRAKDDEGRWCHRSPAMAAGVAAHVWTGREWFTRPAVQPAQDTTAGSPLRFGIRQQLLKCLAFVPLAGSLGDAEEFDDGTALLLSEPCYTSPGPRLRFLANG